MLTGSFYEAHFSFNTQQQMERSVSEKGIK
jgi:hypothetical protein